MTTIITERDRATTAPEVNYLAYDGYHVTLAALIANLDDIGTALREGQRRAFEEGQEDLSNVFADAFDELMEIMPGVVARGKAAQEGGARS